MKTSACLTVLAGSVALLTGCQSTGYHAARTALWPIPFEPGAEDVSYAAISSNLTPELAGLVERPIDVDRNLSISSNQNWRMFSDDWGRVFYTDHPSRLSPMPIVSTSGNPR